MQTHGMLSRFLNILAVSKSLNGGDLHDMKITLQFPSHENYSQEHAVLPDQDLYRALYFTM